MRCRSYAFPDQTSNALTANIIMTNFTSDDTGNAIWRIDGDMTIYRASELKHDLIERLDGAHALDIDLSGITELDCAGVQLLMLAKKTAQEKRCVLRFLAHSPAVLEVFEQLRLTNYFSDDLVFAPDQPGRSPTAGDPDER